MVRRRRVYNPFLHNVPGHTDITHTSPHSAATTTPEPSARLHPGHSSHTLKVAHARSSVYLSISLKSVMYWFIYQKSLFYDPFVIWRSRIQYKIMSEFLFYKSQNNVPTFEGNVAHK